jgi:hypothetical protein
MRGFSGGLWGSYFGSIKERTLVRVAVKGAWEVQLAVVRLRVMSYIMVIRYDGWKSGELLTRVPL